MREWSQTILLIFLVPRMLALEGNNSSVPIEQILDTEHLFAQIDDFFKKLACPESLLQPKGLHDFFPEGVTSLVNESINTQVDLATRMKARVRSELIDGLLTNPELAKKCSNIGLLNEKQDKHRTFGPLLDIFRMKLCFLQMIFDRCVKHRPKYRPSSEYSECIPYDKWTLRPSGRWKKRNLLNCTTSDSSEESEWRTAPFDLKDL